MDQKMATYAFGLIAGLFAVYVVRKFVNFQITGIYIGLFIGWMLLLWVYTEIRRRLRK